MKSTLTLLLNLEHKIFVLSLNLSGYSTYNISSTLCNTVVAMFCNTLKKNSASDGAEKGLVRRRMSILLPGCLVAAHPQLTECLL